VPGVGGNEGRHIGRWSDYPQNVIEELSPMSAFPPPPPWTSGFRAQRAAMEADSHDDPRRKNRGDTWEWLVLTGIVAVVVLVLLMK